jgi:hypothetical protein
MLAIQLGQISPDMIRLVLFFPDHNAFVPSFISQYSSRTKSVSGLDTDQRWSYSCRFVLPHTLLILATQASFFCPLDLSVKFCRENLTL